MNTSTKPARRRGNVLWISAGLLCAIGVVVRVAFQLDVAASLGLVSLLATIAITAYRWDWNCWEPRTRFGWSSLVLSPALAMAGVLTRLPWLSGASVLLLFLAFWHAHRCRFTGSRLEHIWPALMGYVAWPAFVGLWVWQTYTPVFSKCLQSGFRYFKIPHVVYPPAVVLEDYKLFLDEMTLSIFSGLLFVAASGIYSAWLRRNTLLSAMNILLALGACALFQTGLYLTAGVADIRYEVNVGRAYPWILLVFSWLLISAMVFLSLERLMRALLYPISDVFLPRQANPFALVWNKATAIASTQSPRASSPSSKADPASTSLRSAARTAITLLLFLAAAIVQIQSAMFSSEQVVDVLVSPALGQDLDHRHSSSLVTSSHPSLQVDIYSQLTPLLAEEIAVFGNYITAAEALGLAAGRGWDTTAAMELGQAERATSASMGEDKFEATTIYFTVYLDPQGTLIQESRDHQADNVATVHVIARFAAPPSSLQLASLKERFEARLASASS